MDPSEPTLPAHPVLDCAAQIDAALSEVAVVDPVFMTTAQKRRALLALHGLESRVAALRLRVVAASADVAADEGHRDVAAWLAHRTHSDRAGARRHQRLATALDQRWHALGHALTTGAVNLDQAHAIARTLDDLPTDPRHGVTAQVRADAEAHLITLAATWGPAELARLGAKVLEVVAPEVAEDAERRRLLAEERRARRGTTLSVRDLGDGTALIKARVPVATAQRLTTYLEAFTNPRQPANQAARGRQDDASASALGEPVPYQVRLGKAFCSLLEVLDPRRLPLHGGDATTVVISIDLEDLMSGLGTAALESGDRITAGEARRLACTAKLIPAVLGTGSHPLDLGLSARLFSPTQRRALAIRDKRCRADGCSIPAAWCEAHHLVPWSLDGPTDLANGILLCSHHHQRIHDDRYLHSRMPDGDVRFSRRR
ncbi:HNH endonuclease signature motif containing protein [Nocardioides campestrisoli]|uniref:HNH endonuclease signature motif containing protein n=1 Tax=Nocardioides campestrisoli TaxID=2736757 RepID=UPI00163DD1AF|nr:HNH endonuclease signature motif containing protein [Nocardioides campestrisoli]